MRVHNGQPPTGILADQDDQAVATIRLVTNKSKILSVLNRLYAG